MSTDKTATHINEADESALETEKWVETFESKDKKFDVIIDASIVKPDPLPSKIFTANSIAFSEDQINKIVQVLCENKSLYKSGQYGTLTKEKVQEEIISLKMLRETLSDDAKGEINATISMLEDMYADLPANNERKKKQNLLGG